LSKLLKENIYKIIPLGKYIKNYYPDNPAVFLCRAQPYAPCVICGTHNVSLLTAQNLYLLPVNG